MKRRWLVCSVVLLSLVLALPASTQTPTYSVLQNGDFELDIDGWMVHAGSLQHTSDTTHGGSAGAALVWPWDWGASAEQCVDISEELATWPEDGGLKYITYNGYLLSADGISPMWLFTTFYGNTSCGSGDQIGFYVSSGTTSNNWTFQTQTLAIPEGTQSIGFGFWNGLVEGTGVIYADDLTAFSSTTTAVQSRGIAARNSLWAVGLVGVAAVVVVLERRKKAA